MVVLVASVAVLGSVIGGIFGFFLGRQGIPIRYGLVAASAVFKSASLVIDQARSELFLALKASAETCHDMEERVKAVGDHAKKLRDAVTAYLRDLSDSERLQSPTGTTAETRRVELNAALRQALADLEKKLGR